MIAKQWSLSILVRQQSLVVIEKIAHIPTRAKAKESICYNP